RDHPNSKSESAPRGCPVPWPLSRRNQKHLIPYIGVCNGGPRFVTRQKQSPVTVEPGIVCRGGACPSRVKCRHNVSVLAPPRKPSPTHCGALAPRRPNPPVTRGNWPENPLTRCGNIPKPPSSCSRPSLSGLWPLLARLAWRVIRASACIGRFL